MGGYVCPSPIFNNTSFANAKQPSCVILRRRFPRECVQQYPPCRLAPFCSPEKSCFQFADTGNPSSRRKVIDKASYRDILL
ncbi:hypothetical protein F3P66_15875 [Agrobacterium fabrum]|uniref:Uncharacterized protein n=1 Tax=Agrobacterium fabrum (strain C58 / ATCC 33970) TaxID=176299 RepID=A9CEY3_AGRFC|nr:hypothetical protein Atu3270 [Agrobacterium fabrum str. C58]QRM60954.1 hypothetical protein F3P66_15875 [Agrobacterium fabrum]TRB29864.1 hypothetical protein EXN51_08700 [Agrobacterium fabrum]